MNNDVLNVSGKPVNFDLYGDPQVPAVVLRTFLRELQSLCWVSGHVTGSGVAGEEPLRCGEQPEGQQVSTDA